MKGNINLSRIFRHIVQTVRARLRLKNLKRNDAIEMGGHTPQACGLRRRAANVVTLIAFTIQWTPNGGRMPSARRRWEHAGRVRSQNPTASFRLSASACAPLLLSLLITGCTTVPQKPPAPVLKSEFIYESAPFPSCHASTIAETKSGLVAAWFGGTAERNPDVCIYVSRNMNGQWTPPVAVADGVGFATNRLPTWNPVLFQPKSGPLLLFYKVGPSPATWWGMMKTSADNGKTWSEAKRLPDGILGPIKNKPVQLANRDILSPSSTEGSGGWRVHFERSTDGGKTWTATPPVNHVKMIGAIQPSILFLKDGKLESIGRTKDGKLFHIFSEDDGITWGEMTLMDLPNPNSGTDAVTLQDGRQLLVYNHNLRTGSNNKGRSPLNVAVSDDGEHWQAALVLEDAPDAPNGFAYPAVIQTSDGLVHITYTWERKRIKHVVIDPKKLSLKPIMNSEWPK
jgi:predicted neuraminidase